MHYVSMKVLITILFLTDIKDLSYNKAGRQSHPNRLEASATPLFPVIVVDFYTSSYLVLINLMDNQMLRPEGR